MSLLSFLFCVLVTLWRNSLSYSLYFKRSKFNHSQSDLGKLNHPTSHHNNRFFNPRDISIFQYGAKQFLSDEYIKRSGNFSSPDKSLLQPKYHRELHRFCQSGNIDILRFERLWYVLFPTEKIRRYFHCKRRLPFLF